MYNFQAAVNRGEVRPIIYRGKEIIVDMVYSEILRLHAEYTISNTVAIYKGLFDTKCKLQIAKNLEILRREFVEYYKISKDRVIMEYEHLNKEIITYAFVYPEKKFSPQGF